MHDASHHMPLDHRETSTNRAPWCVIPSNHKWFRDLAISAILVDTLAEMDIRM
jgi:polyphosphate kinase 2 (PPK2 family)